MDELHSKPYSLTDLLALCDLPNEYVWMALRQLWSFMVRGRFAKLTVFRIYRWGGWSGQEIEDKLFEDFGIRISVRAFDKEHLFFSIFDSSQERHVATWAEYILRREGVPMLNIVDCNNLKAEELGSIPRR